VSGTGKREIPMIADIFGVDGVIVVVVVVVVLLFGGSKIPKLARSLGSAQKEFKKGLDEGAKDTDAPDELDAGGKRADDKAKSTDRSTDEQD
jgi:sec-independent protein translocase protein TatA